MDENVNVGHRNRNVYAFIGFLLGMGAPLGWLFLRTLFTQRSWLIPWIRGEFLQSGELYTYMTAGSVIVFTLFGAFLGRRSDGLEAESTSARNALDQVTQLAATDALTGIHNARYLHDHLSTEIESARRYQMPLTCLMIDIDDFKNINDTYGHPAGDTILTTLAKVIQLSVRRVDIVGRLGGEEFLVIMPHTGWETAIQIAERLRQSIENWPFILNETRVPLTVSIGIAACPADGEMSKGSLLQAADKALYQAKREGKNRTVLSKDNSLGEKDFKEKIQKYSGGKN